jgi:uncharacterized protein YsxB (DUF464 family)
MIRINVIRDNKGLVRQFSVEGHAEYADYGSDIVCAAISVTAYTALGALESLAGLQGFYSLKEGYVNCKIPSELDANTKQTVKVILETTVIGFKQIESKYKEYVSVFDKEV